MKTRSIVILIALSSTGCLRGASSPKAEPAMDSKEAEAAPTTRGGGPGGGEERKKKGFAAHAAAKPVSQGLLKLLSGKDGAAGNGMAAAASDSPAPPPSAEAADEELKNESGEGGGGGAKSRAWFPETFLFEPLVVTDDGGSARVHVRVPDRLTTWRILALAHSRDGAQAGTETSFLGTLPVYVDPVLPSFLMAGDEVKIPVQVVNTTDGTIERTLFIDASGAAGAHEKKAVKVPATSSKVELAALRASKPGRVTFKATLGDRDAFEKMFTVFPTGRPNVQNKGGTLAAPRSIEIDIPKDAEKDASSVRLLVFPGALALLRSELGRASSRGGVASDAYALLLAGKGDGLLRALGGDPDPKGMRNLAIVAGQRAIRDARSPNTATATLLAEAALAFDDAQNPVIARLGERLADTVARNQRPDGTFQGETGWTLQRLLVASAASVRAVLAADSTPAQKQRAERIRLLAEGAFERNLERVEDPYTAATIVASGAVSGSIAERLRAKVREKLAKTSDGGKSLGVESGVVRGDGLEPSRIEATAFSVLALIGDEKAKAELPDLGATLLAAYDPSRGWGDGETNLIALRAVLALFKEPLPPRVKVTLEYDDKTLGEGVLEGVKLRDVLPIDADLPNASGKHTLKIKAEPPVPGLGFSLTWKVFEPWTEPEERGMEITVEPPKNVRVGKSVELAVIASAPAGIPLSVRASLPAGVETDKPSLDALVAQGTILSYRAEDGAVTLEVAARQPSQPFEARFKVIATLSGALHSGPSTIHAASGSGETYFAPPAKWAIAER